MQKHKFLVANQYVLIKLFLKECTDMIILLGQVSNIISLLDLENT